jgi:serine phosphatase RsbU (regulator of sigma subunit)
MLRKIIKSNTHREFRTYYATIVLGLLIIIGLIQILAMNAPARMLDRQIFHPVVFKLREFIKPKRLDPRIKIFAYDDRTAAHEGGGFLTLKDWGSALRSIASTPNTHIIIDKLFDFPEPSAKIEEFQPMPGNAQNTKIGAIVFASTKSISFRQEIPADVIQANEKATFLQLPGDAGAISAPHIFFGANRDILKSFSVFGFANYAGDHYVKPILRGNSGHMAHLALAITGNIDTANGQVRIGSNIVPRNRAGDILVNFRDPSVYRSNAVTFLSVVERARRGLPVDIVKPGDYVVILPAMYTGHTDFVSSPFGSIPGGFHLVALLDSALTNNWLREVDDPGYFVIVGALVGFCIGIFLSSSVSLIGIILAILTAVGSSILLFSFFDISASFTLPTLAILLSGMAGALIRGHITAIENYRRTREISVAGMVQQSFFPKLTSDYSPTSACAVYGRFSPASECGGDWWGTFTKAGHTYIMLGDATGHGFPAALVTSISFAVTKSIQAELNRTGIPLSPSEILTVLNEILCSMESQHSQMTFLVFRINEASGECLYANAGNQPALLIDPSDALKGDKPRSLTALGNVLGVEKNLVFADHTVSLLPGSKIIMFSDGIFENRDASESKQLGKKWLRDIIHQNSILNGLTFIDTVWKAYNDAIGDTTPDDDTTLVVIEYLV